MTSSADQTPRVDDQAQRQRALDPSISCIVQAPAGSGKTSLLTQRYLALLGQVEQPEAILGITFTRKAAAEMLERVMTALIGGQDPEPPAADHERVTWALARTVLDQDRQHHWRILENPVRLRLQTIDAFCSALVRQMPVISEFGAPVSIQSRPERLYQQAARNTLAELETGQSWSDAIATLLRHLDNQLPKLETLLGQMLARRDQWLRHVSGVARQGDTEAPRIQLESVLETIVRAGVDKAFAAISTAALPNLDVLLGFAASNIDKPGHSIVLAAKVGPAVADGVGQRQYVLGVAQLLLTDKDGWRKQVDKKLGFPAPTGLSAERKVLAKSRKEEALTLLESARQRPDLREALIEARNLPASGYSEQQWRVIEALLSLLPLAVAQLRLEFQQTGCVDFCEMAHAAERALGGSQSPTDLALRMDYQIQHLLVDEFQDTSETQYSLLCKLLAGWEPGADRSLFLVGDPMQSIYRFRQAEVGLFLGAQRHGVGPMTDLESLTLSVNFRSQSALVDWFNRHLPQIFPASNDMRLGAIAYAPSTALHPALPEDAVLLHPVVGDRAAEDEAEQICRQICLIRQSQPEDSLAVLVRGRSALAVLIPMLKSHGVDFCAQDIDALAEQTIIKDLLALTQALTCPADRISWLAILRAPWCGLGLHDLHQLVGAQTQACVWDLMQNPELMTGLTTAGQMRLLRMRTILDAAFADQQRQSLSDWVYATWLALAGPACVTDEAALDDARHYFELLAELEQGGEVQRTELTQRVTGLFAAPKQHTGVAVQIMTIHKSKGLEFDHVILPGLGRKAGRDGTPLLNWMELPQFGEQEDGADRGNLLLAPIHATGDEMDPTSRYIKQLQQAKSDQELTRLLYVAMTRARKRLHLWFELSRDEGQGIRAPQKGSLLRALWPAIESDVESILSACSENVSNQVGQDRNASSKTNEKCYVSNYKTSNLFIDYEAPPAADAIRWCSTQLLETHDSEHLLEFDWASDLARQIGVVCHRALQRIATQGVEAWLQLSPSSKALYLSSLLREEGVLDVQLAPSLVRLEEIISATLKDNRGQWVLNRQHTEQDCELALTGVLGGRVVHGVLDRTFVDKGVRWIVDYKTGSHSGEDREGFMDNEVKRYREQLNGYARLMRLQEQRPIQLGLYFPAMSGWREWPFVDASDQTASE